MSSSHNSHSKDPNVESVIIAQNGDKTGKANLPPWLELPVTVTVAAPRVGVGTGFCTPFIESARSESWANPTEGGVARKTE